VKLYKYRAANKNTVISLWLDISYFAAASQLNDPCDSQMTIVKPTEKSQIDAIAVKIFEEALPPGVSVDSQNARGNFEALFHSFADKKIKDFGGRGIFSLSEVPDHHLMWSHYADSHTGICIEFDVDPSVHDFLRPVKYSDDQPPVLLTDVLEKEKEAIGNFYFQKTNDWQYEREWRLITVRGGTMGQNIFRISGLIIGARTSDLDALFVAVIATTRNIPLYNASHG